VCNLIHGDQEFKADLCLAGKKKALFGLLEKKWSIFLLFWVKRKERAFRSKKKTKKKTPLVLVGGREKRR